MLPNRKAINPAKFTFKNIKNYISYIFRTIKLYFAKKSIYKDDTYFQHEQEQIEYRAIIAENFAQCTTKESCTYCGCSTKNLAKYKGNNPCEEKGCYSFPIMNRTDWNNYKKTNNINI